MDMESIKRKLRASLAVTAPGAMGNTSAVRAAVMILLAPTPDGPSIGLIRRARAGDVHSGQISFPGGRMEPGETPLQTALREMEEEIGVSGSQVEILGFMPPAHTWTTGFIVWPVAGALAQEPIIKVAPAEVEEFFWLPADFLEGLRGMNPDASLPGVEYQERRIWGLTFRILAALGRLLRNERED